VTCSASCIWLRTLVCTQHVGTYNAACLHTVLQYTTCCIEWGCYFTSPHVQCKAVKCSAGGNTQIRPPFDHHLCWKPETFGHSACRKSDSIKHRVGPVACAALVNTILLYWPSYPLGGGFKCQLHLLTAWVFLAKHGQTDCYQQDRKQYLTVGSEVTFHLTHMRSFAQPFA